MILHKYYFKLIIEPIYEFYILFQVEGNEKAIDAVKLSQKFADEHLSSHNKKALAEYQYETEYMGTQMSDGYQQAKIKNTEQKYIYIPLKNNQDIVQETL